MHILLVYDIPDDRIRAKVADICQDYGLDRAQYSAFIGELARIQQEALMGKIRQRLGKQAGKIALFPVCERDWTARIEIERKPKPGERNEEEKIDAGSDRGARQ